MTTTIAVQEVPLELIVPTPDNRRRIHEGSPEFREFVENIRALGVLEPGLGRPHPEQAGKIDLRAGERRYRACQAAGFATMPVIVREMTDEEALAVTVTENLQRESLHPLEEGETLALMLERGWTADQAANQLGRSTKWVLRRARLNELSEEWRNSATDPESVIYSWSASHLELIARYPAPTQRVLAAVMMPGSAKNLWLDRLTLADLRDEVGAHLQQISLAVWDIQESDIVPGVCACAGCPKRSDVQPELWDEADFGEAGPGARCLDKACWDAKSEAFVRATLKRLREKHGALVVCVSESYRYSGPFENVINGYGFTGCKKKDAGAVMLLWVDGPKAGRSYWARSHSTVKRVGENGQDKEKAPRPLAERRAQLERIRCRVVNGKIAAQLTQWIMQREEPPAVGGHMSVRLAICFGTADRWDVAGKHHDDETGKSVNPWVELEKCKKGMSLASADQALFLQVLPVLRKRVLSENQENDFQKPVQPATYEGRAVCELLGLDWDLFYADACKEKPEPKSWAKEVENEAGEAETVGVTCACRGGGDEEE